MGKRLAIIYNRKLLYAVGLSVIGHIVLCLALMWQSNSGINALSPHSLQLELVDDWPRLSLSSDGHRAVKNLVSSRADAHQNKPLNEHSAVSNAVPNMGTTTVESNASDTHTALIKALQFDRACQTAIARGQSVPENCDRKALSQSPSLGPRNVPEFQAAANRINMHLAYLTSPGSPDLWRQANHKPAPNDRPNDLPEYGLYDGDPLKQRVIGQCTLTSSCTKDGHDPRTPSYQPGVVKWTSPEKPGN